MVGAAALVLVGAAALVMVGAATLVVVGANALTGVGGFPAAADGGGFHVVETAVAALELVGATAPADGGDLAAAAVFLPTGWGSLNPEE